MVATGVLTSAACFSKPEPTTDNKAADKTATKDTATTAGPAQDGPVAKEDPPEQPDAVAGVEAARSGSCAAEPSWLQNPALPTEVSGEGTECDFEQFMWQSMLALVQPTSGPGSALEFETWMPSYGIFIKEGQPAAWGEPPPPTCKPAPPPGPDGKPLRVYSDIIKQAGANQPLIALDGEFVYYSMSVDKHAYDMLTGCELYKSNCAGPLEPGNEGIDLIGKYPNLAFPDGAIELKTSWMILDETEVASRKFHTVPGLVQQEGQHEGGDCRQVQLGLVANHIVSKTPKFPALIWATFEHRNNAPDCDNTAAKPPIDGLPWNFYNPDCKDCVTNTYAAGKPAQVCRMHPHGDSHVGIFPGGEDCKADPNQYACQPDVVAQLEQSSKAIADLNRNIQGLITANPQLIDGVWANYELVGNVWTIGKTLPPYQQAQRGSLSASNTSMETFVQNGVAAVTNPYDCFSCHNMEGPEDGRNLPPVGLSHLFQEVQMSGGCDEGELPPACAPYLNN